MSSIPNRAVMRGTFDDGGPIELLRTIEGLRTTGLVRFLSSDGTISGTIGLVGGQVAVDQSPLSGGEDPVEVLLRLQGGSYELHQLLPPLPVSTGDDHVRSGSLAVHVPADLMNYCEHAGLTGLLTFEKDGRRAEAVYEAGELLAIRLDGSDDADLQEVFAWEEGTFRIEALSESPADQRSTTPEHGPPHVSVRPDGSTPPKSVTDEVGQEFLRVVEVALSSVVETRERKRSPTRQGPSLPPVPAARRSSIPAPRPRRRETTVKIMYRGTEGLHSGAPGAPSQHAPPVAVVSTPAVATPPDPERFEPAGELLSPLIWVTLLVALAFSALSLLTDARVFN